MGADARTIVLRGNQNHHIEGTLSTTAKPGMHVTLQSSGNYARSPETTAELVKYGSSLVVKEDALQGKTVNDSYNNGDRVFMYVPVAGDVLNLLIKSGQNISVGDNIIAEGGGSGLFIKSDGTHAAYKFRALESSGGVLGADTLLACLFTG